MSVYCVGGSPVELATGLMSDERWMPLFALVPSRLLDQGCSELVRDRRFQLYVGCLQAPPRAGDELSWARQALMHHQHHRGRLGFEALKCRDDLEKAKCALETASVPPRGGFVTDVEIWPPALYLPAVGVWSADSWSFNVIVLAPNGSVLDRSLHVISAMLHPISDCLPVPRSLMAAHHSLWSVVESLGCVGAPRCDSPGASHTTSGPVPAGVSGISGGLGSVGRELRRVSLDDGLRMSSWPCDPIWMGPFLVWYLVSVCGVTDGLLLVCGDLELLDASDDVLDAVCDAVSCPPGRWELLHEEELSERRDLMSMFRDSPEFVFCKSVLSVTYDRYCALGLGVNLARCRQACRLSLALHMLYEEPHLLPGVLEEVPVLASRL